MTHKWKQAWFARQESDIGVRTFNRKAIRLAEEAGLGVVDRRKQDATYVGLTRTRKGQLDPDGRILSPVSRVGEKQVAEQVTRVGDVLTSLVEGYLDGRLMMDTEELEACLTPELAAELDELWSVGGRSMDQGLERQAVPGSRVQRSDRRATVLGTQHGCQM